MNTEAKMETTDDVWTPINDCSWKDEEDGTCCHPRNITPECHIGCCPRIHLKIAKKFEC